VQIKTGLPGETTQAEAKTMAGCVTKSVNQNTINADGTTIARVYYDRKDITYTFTLNSNYGKFADNTTSKSISKRYGSKVEPPSTKVLPTYYYRFINWYNLPETYDDVNKTFTAQFDIVYDSEIIYLAPGTNGSAGRNCTYVYFGYWPQSGSYFSNLVKNPTKSVFGSESQYVYLGTDNRYYYKDSSASTSGCLMTPIKWRVVTTNYKDTGKALLVAEDILIASPVNTNNGTGASYWSSSIIRTYLNDSFYNNAFLTDAKTLISETDTSIQSMQTTDKVFILSLAEIINSENGLTDSATRRRTATEYAKGKNICPSYSFGCRYNGQIYNYWWLRDYSITPEYVNYGGLTSSISYTTPYIGVVPAIVVDLPAQ
ncbi:MAG: DUF6273 domain-containing protein, partial [Treponema sp.]|nr:DUF6273 domain-containing protein [Treponema sp.]